MKKKLKIKQKGSMLLMLLVAMGMLSVVGGTVMIYKHQQMTNQRKADEWEKLAMIERSWAEVITSGKLPDVPSSGIHGLPIMDGLERPEHLSVKVVRKPAKPGSIPTAQISLIGAKTIPMAIGYMADPDNAVAPPEPTPHDAWVSISAPTEVIRGNNYTVSWTSHNMATGGGQMGPFVWQDGNLIDRDRLNGSVVVTATNSGAVQFKIKGWTAEFPRDIRTDGTTVNVLLPKAATPVISPSSGSYSNASGTISVTMSCATAGATIRYTTNGANVTSSSPVYGGAITLGTGSHTVKAKAFRSDYRDSDQASRSYTLTQMPKVVTPVISPSTSSHTGSVSVSITCATSGATIRYTTNGSDVTPSSPVYTGAFTLGVGSYTVKARGYKSGMDASNQTQRSYSITSSGGGGSGGGTTTTDPIEDPDSGVGAVVLINTLTPTVKVGEDIVLEWNSNVSANVVETAPNNVSTRTLATGSLGVQSNKRYNTAGWEPGYYTYTISGGGASMSVEVEILNAPDHRLDIAFEKPGTILNGTDYYGLLNSTRTQDIAIIKNTYPLKYHADLIAVYDELVGRCGVAGINSGNAQTHSRGAVRGEISTYMLRHDVYDGNQGIVTYTYGLGWITLFAPQN